MAVWRTPLLGLGSDSYGHDLVQRCGAVNVLGGRPRYPEMSEAEVTALAPDLVLLPDEPYRFREHDREAFCGIAPATIVDGKLLWWVRATDAGGGQDTPGAVRDRRDVRIVGPPRKRSGPWSKASG